MQEKNIKVIAREGYNVLLDIHHQTLMIDCYNFVDLSAMFTQEILNECVSLQSHLREGNLVIYEGQELTQDPNEFQITKLAEVSEQQIKAQYSQKSGRADAFNVNVETVSDLSAKMIKNIDELVEKNRVEIIKQDNKILDHLISPSSPEESLPEGHQMTESELHLNVVMDVDNNTFEAVQEQGRIDIINKEDEDERAANNEINKQNNNEN
jgi:hypothetical protein